MNVFYLISIILGIAIQNIVKKPYTIKTKGNGSYFFGAVMSFSATLTFLIICRKPIINPYVIPYAAAFAILHSVATVSTVIAISCGLLSLTSLMIQYSLMLPTFYGLFFLNDPLSIGFIPGLIFLIISILLINKKDENKILSFKWIVATFFAFLCNGLCTIVQRVQQIKFDSQYNNEFMLIARIICLFGFFMLFFIKERKDLKLYVKSGWQYAFVCGLANSIVNIFVMLLSDNMWLSLMFPLISAGGIIVTYLVSILLYKVSFSKKQFTGFIFGIISIVLLNI